MNILDLQQRFSDLVKLLQVYAAEVEAFDHKTQALEQSQLVATARDQRLSAREVVMSKKEADLTAQQTHIEEMNRNTALVLAKITVEKQALAGLAAEKLALVSEKAHFEIEKKSVEQLKKEGDSLRHDKEQLEQARALFAKEKEAIKEEHKLLALREQHITAKEEKLDKIERMTQL